MCVCVYDVWRLIISHNSAVGTRCLGLDGGGGGTLTRTEKRVKQDEYGVVVGLVEG